MTSGTLPEAAGLAALLCCGLAFAAYRIARNAATWVGRWSYDLTDDAIVVRAAIPLPVPLRPVRIAFDRIDRVERTAGPPAGGATVPWRFGNKTYLGSLARLDTVDVYRRGTFARTAILTPDDADGFARDLRAALVAYRAARGAKRGGAWYTRQS